jgi:hypothetical protein
MGDSKLQDQTILGIQNLIKSSGSDCGKEVIPPQFPR